MHEDELSIENGGVRLAGALSLPQVPGPWPVVLCLHGSGPLDRDQNPARGPRMNIFNTIAADLARRGIATLRHDKRGCGRSGGDYYAAGHAELMSDAAAWLRRLEADDRFTARLALGHSAGTLMAAELSQAHDLAGLVLLCPYIEPLEEILLRQGEEIEQALRTRRGLSGALYRLLLPVLAPRRRQAKILARLRATSEPVLREGLQRLPAKWLRESMALDPAAIYAGVQVPALVLGGGKDLQCNPADVGRIAAVLGALATPVLIDDLTHILRRDTESPSLFSYPRLLKQPMDAEVVRLVGEWVAARSG